LAQATLPEEETETVSDRQGLNVIVVTATKRATDLQDVPVAVTAFTGEALEAQNAVEVADVARLTPGFYARVASGNPSALNYTIRGQVQNDVLATLDPSVGTYVDELYWARAYGANASLLDVESVQVLRGPQGTLFGRNTTGGAVLINTNRPDTDDFSIAASGTYGRFDELSATGVVNLPIIEDGLALRGAINYSERDGYLTDNGYANNIGGNQGQKYNGRETLTGRVKLLATPTEAIDLELSAEFYNLDSSMLSFQTIYAFDDPANPRNVRNIASASGSDIDDYIDKVMDDPDFISLNTPPLTEVDTQTYIGKVGFDFGPSDFKMILGYRQIDSFSQLDLDGSPFAAHTTIGVQDLEQYSAEVQLSGLTFNDNLEYVVGANYFSENGSDQSFSAPDETFAAPTASLLEGIIDNEAFGVYAQGTFDVTETISLTAGVRYTDEEKGITINNRLGTFDFLETGEAFQPVPGLNFCLYPAAAVTPNSCVQSRKDSFDGWSYTFGVDYEPNSDFLLYAKTSKGFRSGGQNLRAILTAETFVPFEPEIAYQHEIGLKSTTFDNRVRFNAAGYYTTIKEFQASIIVGGATGASTIVQNAADVTIWGLEAEAQFEVVTDFVLSGSAGYTNAEFDEYIDFAGNDLSDSNFTLVPEFQFSLAADYGVPVAGNQLDIHVDYSWNSEIAYDDDSRTFLQEFIVGPESGSLNARLGYSFADDRFQVAVFGRNILDNRDLNNALLVENPYGYVSARYREPTTYGVSASVRFGN
jgi:iron complex outermembrane receptor protein